MIILEAWSADKPVVATGTGGQAEIIWHNVTGYITYCHPKSIVWGIGTLFSNFEHGRWMGRNGRVAVESAFTWDAIADKVLGVYYSF